MRLAYIILTHNFPDQLGRLINRLAGPEITFVVHIDLKVKIDPFLKVARMCTSPVFFAERESCSWGDVSLVKATLNSIDALIKNQIIFDYAILLSGQDYPVKSNEYILEFFNNSDRNLYMEIFDKAACTKGWQHLVFSFRLNKHFLLKQGDWYSFSKSKRAGELCIRKKIGEDWTKIEKRDIGEFSQKLIFPRRLPLNLKPWGGSQWWALTYDAIKYIFDFCHNHLDYLAFHQSTYIPDEIFFQTIIMNHPFFNKYVINHRLRFLDWSKDPKPMVFDDTYLTEFEEICRENPNFLFARKFEPIRSERILNYIDNLLDQ